jgi:hypothetical protein
VRFSWESIFGSVLMLPACYCAFRWGKASGWGKGWDEAQASRDKIDMLDLEMDVLDDIAREGDGP